MDDRALIEMWLAENLRELQKQDVNYGKKRPGNSKQYIAYLKSRNKRKKHHDQ